jgi:hypothetical protein
VGYLPDGVSLVVIARCIVFPVVLRTIGHSDTTKMIVRRHHPHWAIVKLNAVSVC